MSSFTTPLVVKHLDGVRWKVVHSFVYHVGTEDSEEKIIVPGEFITDFASIPRIFWTLIGHPTGKYGKAAVIHDYCYYERIYSRKKSDLIFEEGMAVLKVPFWKRKTMYFAVRSFGWIPWNRYRKSNGRKQ